MSTSEKSCVLCGDGIPEKRLHAIPGTTTCVNCSSATKKKINDMPGSATVQHTGGLHEKYLKEGVTCLKEVVCTVANLVARVLGNSGLMDLMETMFAPSVFSTDRQSD